MLPTVSLKSSEVSPKMSTKCSATPNKSNILPEKKNGTLSNNMSVCVSVRVCVPEFLFYFDRFKSASEDFLQPAPLITQTK